MTWFEAFLIWCSLCVAFCYAFGNIKRAQPEDEFRDE